MKALHYKHYVQPRAPSNARRPNSDSITYSFFAYAYNSYTMCISQFNDVNSIHSLESSLEMINTKKTLLKLYKHN